MTITGVTPCHTSHQASDMRGRRVILRTGWNDNNMLFAETDMEELKVVPSERTRLKRRPNQE